MATLLSFVLFYLFPNSFGIAPKSNLLITGALSLALLITWRRLAYKLFAERFGYKIALIGTHDGATTTAMQQLADEIAAHPHIGTIIAHTDSYADVPAETTLLITEQADIHRLIGTVRATHCDTLSLYAAYESLLGKIPVELMTDEQALDIISTPRFGGYEALVRIAEIVFALFVLIVASPFVLLAAIAVFVDDRGPVLYTQRRVGKYNSTFMLYKLRSMRTDAEKHGAQWAATHDARITRVGRFLRASHLDEVPQMINIIKGDLALIGPRPERPEFVAQLEQDIPYYALRHTIRPGFTGWAQIKFRYARTTDDSREKFAYDLYYLKNRQPLLDVGIVLKTVQIIFTH